MNEKNGPATPPRSSAFPRPQMEREMWTDLNGLWDFSFDRNGVLTTPGEVTWDSSILVPFSP